MYKCPLSLTKDWDHSQRKVVRYDHSTGDVVEPKGGHGTKVAGAAVAKLNDEKANGIAEGAKLHIYDIQVGTGKCYSSQVDVLCDRIDHCMPPATYTNLHLPVCTFRWLQDAWSVHVLRINA
jgi:hypothetical protein